MNKLKSFFNKILVGIVRFIFWIFTPIRKLDELSDKLDGLDEK